MYWADGCLEKSPQPSDSLLALQQAKDMLLEHILALKCLLHAFICFKSNEYSQLVKSRGYLFCTKQTSTPMQCILCINHILFLPYQHYMCVWDSWCLTNDPSLTFPNLTAISQHTHWLEQQRQHCHLIKPKVPWLHDVKLNFHQLHHLHPTESMLALWDKKIWSPAPKI